MSLIFADLPRLFPDLAGPDRWLPLLEQHAALVEAGSTRANLTSVAPGEVVRRNYAECLELWRIATADGEPQRCADIGPGAGYPGLVLSAVAPDVDFHLVEPLGKRAAFLSGAVAAMGLRNVHIHAMRAEEAGRSVLRGTMDLAVARAVAQLAELLEYAAPLVQRGGRLAFLKGSGVTAEIGASAGAITALGCSPPRLVETRSEVSASPFVVLVDRIGDLPDRFPRRAGIPAKRPLVW